MLVAVIDTGLDITHPDLKEQIHTNPGEISGNGIDDDGNGYVDDVNGWNFPENTEIVYQESLGLEQAHATHIAGIITGSSNADKALTPNENIEIMPLRVFNNGTAYTSDIIAAIEYAEKMGAKIVNCSFGSTENNPALKEAMEKSSMLFICAAGNARTDLEVKPIYPACFGLDNTISVTSENADGGLSYFSNYSPECADVAALGRDVYSTLPDGEYGLQNGTSISAALVSGIAAAVLSTDDALGSPELKARLLETSDKLSSLQETVAEGRRINASDAILNVVKTDIVQNSPENDFEVKGYAPTQSELYQLYSSGSIVQVAAGNDFSLALKNDGTVWSWGGNYVGQCGNGSDDRSVTFTRVIGLTNVINIAAGSEHGLAVKSDGTVWMWGYDWYGVNGGGSIPVQVIGLTGVRSVCGGIHFSLALKPDGTVWGWGYNGYGQLGDGTIDDRSAPGPVSDLTDVTCIAAAGLRSLAVKSDGTVWVWGHDGPGKIGVDTSDERTMPEQVGDVTNAIGVAAGRFHSLAVRSDGTVWPWGDNFYGQLGNGNPYGVEGPVSGLSGVIGIAAGYIHSLAVKADGTVWTWGANGNGELGDGTTIDKSTPAQAILTGVIGVSAGNNHSLALKADGTVWGWGNNDLGQLGQPGVVKTSVPIQCQTNPAQISFTETNYVATIFNSGMDTLTGSAAGIDLYGNAIPIADISYSLGGVYPGVSIDSSTGVVTVDSTARPGSVQVLARYQDLVCSATLTLATAPNSEPLLFSAIRYSIYDIALNINNMSAFAGKSFTLTYDPSVLELVDLCGFTISKEITVGDIPGTEIHITGIAGGTIVMTADKNIPVGKQWSGTINVVKFRAKTSGQAIVSIGYN